MRSAIRHCSLPAVVAACLLLPASMTSGQVLVDDPFVTGFGGWTDTFSGTPFAGGQPTWGVLLSGPNVLSESSDGRAADGTTTGGVADGMYTPYLLVDSSTVTPSQYDLSASIGTYDNDGYGLVFGYQDNDNYFRAGLREQAGSSVGFPEGVSVQKVVNGVITQLGSDTAALPTVDGSLDNVQVSVNGGNWSVSVDGGQVLSGFDADLSPGNYGVMSWGQREGSTGDRFWGTAVDTVSVSSTTVNQSTTFSDALPVNWRPLMMTNAEATQGTGVDDFGNFRMDFRNGTIADDTNGFEWATASAPNVDFIGPGVVVDEAGATSWSDYRMSVRMQNGDNDGVGLLVRVADDDSFYRINFATESMGTSGQRAPRGMSIQKNDNGSWSEIYRDDQADPKFLFSDSVPFDVTVTAIGHAIKVDVINDPEGAATPISYAPVVDNSSPILAGSVGFTNWGSGTQGNGVTFSSYGSNDGPLLVEATTVVEFELSIDRDNGRMVLTNNTLEPVDIAGYAITSNGGALRPDDWTSVTEFYDAAPGDGSVDSTDSWAILESTALILSEEEQPENDGSTLLAGQTVDLGLAWTKSQIEDVAVQINLADGSTVPAFVSFVDGPGGMPYSRSDLNTDGSLTLDDWLLFFPNTFADMDALTAVEAALAGDLDLDGDNDVQDFGLFKADYDAANGAGAFQAMVSGARVPEPSAMAMFALAAIGLASYRLKPKLSEIARRGAVAAVCLFLLLVVGQRVGNAVPVDFTAFNSDSFPLVSGGPPAIWETTSTTARVPGNASPSVLYGPSSALNKRYIGRITPGTDDDMVGLVFGYQPGDADYFGSLTGDYLLIDWKGIDQNFDFTDDPADEDGDIAFHQFTVGGTAPVGLGLSRVEGVPTADELWLHTNYPPGNPYGGFPDDNPDGGVVELARGATLGSTAYPRNNTSFLIDVTYTPTNITVLVDGVEQFNENGSFPDGRFGLYTLQQSLPTFSNFEEVSVGFTGLEAVVDRSDGSVTLVNNGTALDIDFYQLTSPGGSLNSTIGTGSGEWTSINSTESDAAGVGWDEAGGSSSTNIGELLLDGSATVAGSSMISLGEAYNNLINAEDLVLRYRIAGSELVMEVDASYINSPPAGLAGDYNGDGTVNIADYTIWRNNLGSTTANLPGDSTPGVVDAADYQVWRDNFGASSLGAVQSSSNTSIPEPASYVMLLGLTLTVLAAHRSRQL
ncbi:PEP-CTERM sorting domain-containing protein [Aeoliella sp.]|uniref:PEP-CTERM sorting domain-containing protein n=1 Tax=Aeoliella sp. TaxID=2795800 RepID=UPI003CCC2A31